MLLTAGTLQNRKCTFVNVIFLQPVCNSFTFSLITIGITYIVICLPEVFNQIFPQYAHKSFWFIGTAFSYIIQTYKTPVIHVMAGFA